MENNSLNLKWNNIQAINGDQKEGFEEFIAQLARKEKIPNGNKFIRKGKPDAGVECFWILDDKTEWAWQAKYFTSSFGESQWRQIDESIKTVLDKHKQITKYIIAIPIDPPDARIDKQKSLLEQWNSRKLKWNELAKKEGLKIEFTAWWSSDLIERLQKPENSGFVSFWFDKEFMIDDWFRQKLNKSIANLKNRYTPEMNFELDIANIFNGVARDDKMNKKLYEKINTVIIDIKRSIPDSKDNVLANHSKALIDYCNFLMQEYENIISNETEHYDFEMLSEKNTQISTILNNIKKRIDELINNDVAQKEKLEYFKYSIRKSYFSLEEFYEFIDSVTIRLFNSPYLLLDGEAGIGKSHLLADIASTRLSECKHSILLLGQHFNVTDSPEKQILDQLGLKCKFNDFLEALNCKAQISKTRLLIFIDAINEGAGKSFWPDYLNGFIEDVRKYKWIGLVLSVRTSYISLFEDNIKCLSNILIRYTHYGFRSVEYEASKAFFKNYNIELPSIPLLHPEFQNPLFLKLFCEGLNKANYSKIPDGINGITGIFDFFIDSINKKLSTPNNFNIPSGINIVKEVICQLTKYKLDNKTYIPINVAIEIILNTQKKYGINGNLTDELFSECILSKNLFWKENIYEEGVYISYERFEDHLIVSEILNNISNEKIKDEFKECGLLFNYIKNESSIRRNKGIIEALSIQLPEKYDTELFELVSDCASCHIADAFVSSLLWRKNNMQVSAKAIEYINNIILKSEETHDYFWDTVIAISINPEHFFNANRIHEVLSKYSLSDRDSWWTQLIHYWYNEDRSIKRLIDWAWSLNDKKYISDECIELSSIMISWFLVSTNRRLRDSSTKALICLLENRVHIAIKLLEKFENINDPYILERIFAVVYGCALRTKNIENLKELSEYVYKQIFNKDEVYPHILLRDYARGIIEYTLYLNIPLKINVEKIRPPYKSVFPQIPSDVEIEKFKVFHKGTIFLDRHQGNGMIFDSMEVELSRDGKVAWYGDFGRYIFQSNFYNWEQFRPIDLKNIAIKKIFDMGYDDEKHGEFDRKIIHPDRHYVEVERIGKKYQWIAMHELLAQISDNYRMIAPWSWGENREIINFTGPWEPCVRDIDPSSINIIEKNNIADIQFKPININWEGDNKLWLKNNLDLPDPKIIMEDNLKEWVMLEGIREFTEDELFGNEKYSLPRKQFWYMIKSYLVSASQYNKIHKWLSNKSFMGRWMPESNHRYEIFNREYYWSPAYDFFKKEYYGREPVHKLVDRKNGKKIGNVILTTESYLWGSQYDFSKEDTLKFLKPCHEFMKEMKLTYKNNDSYMYSKTGELICFDLFEGSSDYPCLFFKKSVLNNFLVKNNYKIIWTVLDEKIIVGTLNYDEYDEWPTSSKIYSIIDNELTQV
jgi:hypothetical protein